MDFYLWTIFILAIIVWCLWQGIKKDKNKKGGDKEVLNKGMAGIPKETD